MKKNIGYYYCSPAVFLNIFKNKELYLSDPLKMNDGLELRWYLQLLINEDEEYRKKQLKLSVSIDEEGEPEFHEYDLDFESALSFMRDHLEYDFSEEDLFDSLKAAQHNVFAICFSMKGDLLGQWRAYGDDGAGVSIGFDLDKLTLSPFLDYEKVLYAPKRIEDDDKKYIEEIPPFISALTQEYGLKTKQQKLEVYINSLLPDMLKYKNPSFKEEKEIRLVYNANPMIEKMIENHGAFQEPLPDPPNLSHQYRMMKDNGITEYVTLKFESNAITDICLGPKCRFGIEDVRNVYKVYVDKSRKLGKNFVHRSKISYR